MDLSKIASDFIKKNDARKHNLISGLLQCTLHILDFLWFDIFNVKRIQNVTPFSRTFYVHFHFKVLWCCALLCFRLYFEYSHVFQKLNYYYMINTWDKLWVVVFFVFNNFPTFYSFIFWILDRALDVFIFNIFALGL